MLVWLLHQHWVAQASRPHSLHPRIVFKIITLHCIIKCLCGCCISIGLLKLRGLILSILVIVFKIITLHCSIIKCLCGCCISIGLLKLRGLILSILVIVFKIITLHCPSSNACVAAASALGCSSFEASFSILVIVFKIITLHCSIECLCGCCISIGLLKLRGLILSIVTYCFFACGLF